MIEKLKISPLFYNMTEKDIENCLLCSHSEILTYEKDTMLFYQQDVPEKLFVLLEGIVAIGRDSISGKRNIITTINQPGELFGEVFLFLNKNQYDNYAIVVERVKVLQMPKEYLYHSCSRNCEYHTVLISNMLSILAQKAYYLNQKLQIMSSSSLRQKISQILLQNTAAGGLVSLKMNREEMADFLNVARPSLSRELMNMQADGLIKMEGKKIKILDFEEMQNNL